jgi:ABC-2 type transport system permease protein
VETAAMRAGLRAARTIWLREMMTFWRERGRIVGMIGQPLLYLFVLGNGITAGMRLNSAQSIGYIQFLYPGVILMSVLFTSVFSAVSIIWDREFGFLKEVLVAPVPRWGVALGKAVGGSTVALLQAAMMVLMAPLVGIGLTVLLVVQLLALAFLVSLAITSIGIAIASRMESMQSFQMVMNFLVMPLFFLSGAMFPMTSAPIWLKTFMALDPLTYGVDALRNVVFSASMTEVDGVMRPLLDVARAGGLVQWSLSLDVTLVLSTVVVSFVLGAWSFSHTQAS